MARHTNVEGRLRHGVSLSLLVHGGIAAALIAMGFAPQRAEPPQTLIEIMTEPARAVGPSGVSAPVAPPRHGDLGAQRSPGAAPRPAAARGAASQAAALAVEHASEPSAAAAIAVVPAATPEAHRQERSERVSSEACEGDDCVLESLDRCIAGNAEGCLGVGEYYERGRRDPFSALKWYAKGCDLGKDAACAALARVKDTRPLGWTG